MLPKGIRYEEAKIRVRQVLHEITAGVGSGFRQSRRHRIRQGNPDNCSRKYGYGSIPIDTFLMG